MKKFKKTFLSYAKNLLPYWKFILPIFVLCTLLYIFILKDLPSPTYLASSSLPQSTQIFDRNNTLLYTVYTKRNQTFVPLSTIPLTVQQATIAIEDKDFYKHGAIDMRGILRAAYVTLFHKQLQGGSTLTQQLVKNTLLTQDRTVIRKVKEIVLSFATELLYPKNRILELYLNQIPYGGTAYGIEAAAQTYFGKDAKDLDLAQSALLAGLPEAPSDFSPFGAHPELAKGRQQNVLRAMLDQGYISKSQYQKAVSEPLVYTKISNSIKAPHFVLYVKQLLIDKYGERMVEQGGLKVKTSLDLTIQEMAEASVAAEVQKVAPYHVTNGAAVVTNPATGEILAMVGSRNYFDDQIDGNVNITTALRQPGSSIKPINYATGLVKGYTAATPFIDEPTCFPNPGNEPAYCPVNYDGKFHGVVEMRYALGNSFNIPAVKMLKANGLDAMLQTAKDMGITTFDQPDKYGLSLTLGGGEVTMLDMAEAYGVFANNGYRIDLHPILEVRDNKGNILEQHQPPTSPIFGKKVLPEGVSFIISDILSDNGARLQEFGSSSELYIPNAVVPVKTGTTNDFRDNWTIGYTKNWVVTVWVGNNDNSPMGGIASGITGAAPIWHDIMTQLLLQKTQKALTRPTNVQSIKICSDTGALPPPDGTPGQCPTRFEYFITGTAGKNAGQVSNTQTWIDKTTQQLPKPGQTDNLELKPATILTDPTGATYCLSCPPPTPEPSPTPH